MSNTRLENLQPWMPALWLTAVWLCLLLSLSAVGYLTPTADQSIEKAITNLLGDHAGSDYGASVAAMGYSGVTFAITLTLSGTCVVWTWSAFNDAQPGLRRNLLWATTVLMVLMAGLSWVIGSTAPFTSQHGSALLVSRSTPGLAVVPILMFLLACAIPFVLVAGASFLLTPITSPDAMSDPFACVRGLAARLKELDQMLYIGALALVFGTLQLNAGLSVPLTWLPTEASLKTQVDLCRDIGPSGAASSVFFSLPSAAAATSGPAGFDAHCSSLPRKVHDLQDADDLRRLVRGVTLCFGLAFSLLLATIYIPTLIGLRHLIERQARQLPSRVRLAGVTDIVDVDPLKRVAAVAATLSPLIAGLLANTLSVT